MGRPPAREEATIDRFLYRFRATDKGSDCTAVSSMGLGIEIFFGVRGYPDRGNYWGGNFVSQKLVI